jgi:hypothetical protein
LWLAFLLLLLLLLLLLQTVSGFTRLLSATDDLVRAVLATVLDCIFVIRLIVCRLAFTAADGVWLHPAAVCC